MNRQEITPEQIKKSRAKAVRITLFVLGGLVLLSVLALLLLHWLLPEKEAETKKDLYFYPVSDQNVFENSAYLAKDRQIYYCENPDGSGRTAVLSEDENFDAKVRFLEGYLNCLILGDETALRALCTENYLKRNEIPDFTQQMLYDMHLYYYSTEVQQDGGQLVTYRLEYKFYQNNGTYRRDVGSDGSKPEYLVLWVSADGTNIKINDIVRT